MIRKIILYLKRKYSFLSEDEIVEDLLLNLTSLDKTILLKQTRESLIRLHFTSGMWIRNRYSLWHEDNPHSYFEDPSHERFPDQVSHRVLERVWETLHAEFGYD